MRAIDSARQVVGGEKASEFVARDFAFGNVAYNDRVSRDLATVFSQDGNQDLRGVPATLLAFTPALLDVPTLFARQRDVLRAAIRVDSLGSVERSRLWPSTASAPKPVSCSTDAFQLSIRPAESSVKRRNR